MADDLTITRGFPDALRSDVATLYDAAFGAKIGIAIPDAAARLSILSEAFDPSHCFIARRGTQLLGVAGFKTRQGAFTAGIELKHLHAQLGILGATRAIAILALFRRGLSPGELLMDGISVAPAARGGGIGTKLLERLRMFAADEGYRTIRLDVIDTNAGARRLYERVGFVATQTAHFHYLRWLLGFSAATTLEYRLTQSA